ncbi:hypothetical protein HOY80DRAFT_1116759 [Tuber brumale]|nr:hypothetical protein HOY80DRAFT_1116759 [Tuber brumale]
MTATFKPPRGLPYGSTHSLQTLDPYHQNAHLEAYWIIMKGEKSMFVGYSAGAYMVFQVDAGYGAAAAVVVGVEGIVHLGKLVEEYVDYEGPVGGEFGGGWEGNDGEVLVEIEDGERGGERVVLIHSSQDC